MEIRPFLKHSLHPRCALRWLEAVPGYSEAARLGQDRQGIRMNKVSNDSAMMCVCVCVFAVRRCKKRRTQLGLGG